jgi:hypothetical protein
MSENLLDPTPAIDLIEKLETVLMSNPREQKLRAKRASIISALRGRKQEAAALLSERIERLGYDPKGDFVRLLRDAIKEIE